MYLLDTDHLVILLTQRGKEYERLSRRIAGHDASIFFVPIISFQEHFAGWQAYLNRHKSAEATVKAYQELERIVSVYAAAQVASFSEGAAHLCESLRKAGVRIGLMDLRIAAIALDRDVVLLSRNRVDFEKVPSLKLEDWTAPPADSSTD